MDDPQATPPREFVGEDLARARFRHCDLMGASFRGIVAEGMEIESPWLLDGEPGAIWVNGVNVAPYVDEELNRRLPGRELRRASDPVGLLRAWDACSTAWATAVAYAEALRPADLDVRVDGEWSVKQTLRHLVMATDTWFGKAILGRGEPYHPIGLPDDTWAEEGRDMKPFTEGDPDLRRILAVRLEKAAEVREFLRSATPELLAEERPNPHSPAYPETVLSCLHTILEEEWEHLRYALRDLNALTVRRTG